MSTNLKSIPKFRTEAEERRFWETHDSSNYVDWRKAERVRLPNLKPSTTSISLRLPVTLLERIKVAANTRCSLSVPDQVMARRKDGNALTIDRIITSLAADFNSIQTSSLYLFSSKRGHEHIG